MLKHILAGTAAVAALALVAPAMAQATNPWAPDQTTVPVNITVNEMVELFTSAPNQFHGGSIDLEIVDAGENQGSAQAESQTINHIHNTDVDVSVEISSDIPDNTQFHIIVEPSDPNWSVPGDLAGTPRVVSWRREGGTYSGATGAFPGQVSSSGVGDTVLAFSEAANAPISSGAAGATKTVQYFADSRNVIPATGTTSFNVVWTIAPQ